MFSIYLADRTLATVGPDDRPYNDIGEAKRDAAARNTRAKELGIATRYVVGVGTLR